MKTKKVKPVLVESESKSCRGDLVIDATRKLGIHIANTEPSYYNKQQLILISLEDEKIEKGNVFYDKSSNRVVTWNMGYALPSECEYCFKVIARQSQLSPELIQQLIDEYNNGGMKDFEIEIEEYDHDEEWSDIGGAYETFKIRPKLTNGFVTVVKEEYSYNLLCNMQYYMEYCVSNGYVTPQEWLKNFKHYSDSKEPILYTEEEVENILIKYSVSLQSVLNKYLIELTPVRWFKENKKNKATTD